MKPNIQEALESGAASILLAFGDQAQTIKTIEEMGELTSVLCRRLNHRDVSQEEIIDEIADVLITVMQLKQMAGSDEVNERILFKLDRTLEVIRSKKSFSKPEKEWDA